MSNFRIEIMYPHHYDEAVALWSSLPGIRIGDMDSKEAIEVYLQRNTDLSRVAFWEKSNRMAGAVLCGHDGRRGFIHHLGVAKDYQFCGLGSLLFRECCRALQSIGIHKVHMFVLSENIEAIKFWRRIGCEQRDDILLFSCRTN